MPGETNGGFTNVGAIAVAALSLVALAASQHGELKGTRPKAETARLHQPSPPQEVQARLWEDPFGSVLRAKTVAEADKTAKCFHIAPSKGVLVKEHDSLDGSSALAGKKRRADKAPPKPKNNREEPPPNSYVNSLSPDTITLAISVSGSSYAADEEARRRARYATVSALGRHGFAPKDREHIGFFYLAESKKDCDTATSRAAIPFEVFETQPDRPRKLQVLVLWMDEANLVDDPLKYFSSVVGHVTRHPDTYPVAIIAPSTSDGLQKLKRDIAEYDKCTYGKCRNIKDEEKFEKINNLNHVLFYSANATAADDELLSDKTCEAGQNGHVASSKFKIERTTPQDDKLSKVIAEELDRRGVNLGPDRIALVAEWDTLYGRLLLKTMKKELIKQKKTNSTTKEKNNCEDENLIIRTYLRGVDGDVASSDKIGAKDPQSGAKDPISTVEQLVRAWREPFTRESTIGVSQFDYIRRLAAELAKINDQARRDQRPRIKAVGLLGNDVFDKLSLLQALKAALPDAIFFTTEYNAHLALPDHQRDSRNLLIASGYGEKLAQALQNDIPQFRDSDQTSLFLAVQIALAQACVKMRSQGGVDGPGCLDPKLSSDTLGLLEHPESQQTPARLFELSRRGEFIELRGEREGAEKPSVQPQLEKNSADYAYATLGFAFIFLGILAPLLHRGAPSAPQRTCRMLYYIYKYYWNAFLVVSGLAILFIVFGFDHVLGVVEKLREPLLIFSGVSLIGPLVFHLFIAVLSFWFIVAALRHLENNAVEIANTFHLMAPDDVMQGNGPHRCSLRLLKQAQLIFSWRGLADILYYTGAVTEPEQDSRQKSANLSVYNMEDNWKVFIRHGAGLVRMFRVFIVFCIPAFIIIFYFSAYILNQSNHGKSIYSIHIFNVICTINIVLAVFILYIVVDVTLSCFLFVRRLGTVTTAWPQSSYYLWEKRFGSTNASSHRMAALSRAEQIVRNQYLDMLFIAKRTKCVNNLIWYPFIVFALLIVANSSYFANFPTSIPFILLHMTGLAMAFGCALALNNAADRSREQTLGALDHARADGEMNKDRWTECREWVSSYSEGSFSAFLAQPAIAAVALPISSIGLPALLQWAGVFSQ